MARSLGKTIRILRQAKELKLNELAERCKLSVPFLSLVENGERQPSLDVMRRIANALRIPSEALVLMGMGPESRLESSDPTAAKIASTVDALIATEEKLKRALGSEETIDARGRNRPAGRRRRHEHG